MYDLQLAVEHAGFSVLLGSLLRQLTGSQANSLAVGQVTWSWCALLGRLLCPLMCSPAPFAAPSCPSCSSGQK